MSFPYGQIPLPPPPPHHFFLPSAPPALRPVPAGAQLRNCLQCWEGLVIWIPVPGFGPAQATPCILCQYWEPHAMWAKPPFPHGFDLNRWRDSTGAVVAPAPNGMGIMATNGMGTMAPTDMGTMAPMGMGMMAPTGMVAPSPYNNAALTGMMAPSGYGNAAHTGMVAPSCDTAGLVNQPVQAPNGMIPRKRKTQDDGASAAGSALKKSRSMSVQDDDDVDEGDSEKNNAVKMPHNAGAMVNHAAPALTTMVAPAPHSAAGRVNHAVQPAPTNMVAPSPHAAERVNQPVPAPISLVAPSPHNAVGRVSHAAPAPTSLVAPSPRNAAERVNQPVPAPHNNAAGRMSPAFPSAAETVMMGLRPTEVSNCTVPAGEPVTTAPSSPSPHNDAAGRMSPAVPVPNGIMPHNAPGRVSPAVPAPTSLVAPSSPDAAERSPWEMSANELLSRAADAEKVWIEWDGESEEEEVWLDGLPAVRQIREMMDT